MDIASVAGLILASFSLLAGFLWEGGHAGALFQPSAALIVFGGTIGATMFSFSMNEIKTVPKLMRIAFFNKTPDIPRLIEEIVEMADEARREGLLYLENRIAGMDDPFMRKGVQLIVDGTDPELVRAIMETEIYNIEQRHKLGSAIFEAAGGYAPTMGIIGTVMGLVHVLGSISTPEKLGPAIAVAFMATLYGVASANVLWFPLSSKLQNVSQKEVLAKELMLEGLISLQAGYNPILIRERLTSYLLPSKREISREEEENE